MATLLRRMWKTHSKHKKLSEEWALADCEEEGWWGEASKEGGAGVRYAGAVTVERAASAPATAIAVRAALHKVNSKTGNKNLQKVSLDISPKGIVVTDVESQDKVLSVSIYRISYCSADAANARVFAVVEGQLGANPDGVVDTHVAHVFVCARRKQARALALALAHAFNDAYQVRFPNEPDEEPVTNLWDDTDTSVVPAPLVNFA